MSVLLLAVSAVMVFALLVGVNFESVASYFTYAVPMAGASVYEEAHVDLIFISDAPVDPGLGDPELRTYFDEADGMLTIWHGEHAAKVPLGASAMATCKEGTGETYMSFFQNRGVFESGNHAMYAMVHFHVDTQAHMPCNVPEIIKHSHGMIKAPAFSDELIMSFVDLRLEAPEGRSAQ